MNVIDFQNNLPQSQDSFLKGEFCSFITSPSTDEDRPTKRHCTEYLRIPCRARSLSDDHNSDTAYFEIPRDAPHGLQLHCSHEECILSGRRFRYCQVCQLPVAKRNFVKRHGHGMVNNSKELRETIDRLHPCRVPTKLTPEQDIDESTQSTIGNLVFQLSESIHDVSASESEDDFQEYDSLLSATCSDGSPVESTTEPLIGINQVTFARQISSEVKSQEFSKRIYSTFSISSTVASSVYEPVPNPLSTPVLIDVPHVIPTSPEVVSCPSDITSIDDILDLPRCLSKSVPLVEPGIRITEDQFAAAIEGIDFAKVFD